MAIRKDGSQLSSNDERNTGLTREGDLSETSRGSENNPDTQNVSSDVEGDEDYDEEELEEKDFDVDEDEEDDEDAE